MSQQHLTQRSVPSPSLNVFLLLASMLSRIPILTVGSFSGPCLASCGESRGLSPGSLLSSALSLASPWCAVPSVGRQSPVSASCPDLSLSTRPLWCTQQLCMEIQRHLKSHKPQTELWVPIARPARPPSQAAAINHPGAEGNAGSYSRLLFSLLHPSHPSLSKS